MSEKNGKAGLHNGTRSVPKITQEFLEINKVSTPVLKLGSFDHQEQNGQISKTLMLIITGNPGQPGYYEDFMQELYSHSNGEIPVWAIGHAGHTQPPNQSLSINDICFTDEKKYGLEAQITHKLRFIEENIPSDVKLILIGHSIGCYMILNMLDSLSKERVLRCFMLMPTIERMALSPNGLSVTPVLRYFRWLLVLCSLFLVLIPKSILSKLVRWHYRDCEYPECVHRSIMNTLNPWTSNFATYLGRLEMNKVTNLQKDLVRRHSEKLCFYYGSKDDWAPVQYYHDFKEAFPEVDVRLCSLNMKHAFVMELREGQDMAEIVWKWLATHHDDILLPTKQRLSLSNGFDK